MNLGDDPSGRYTLLQGPAEEGYMLVDAVDKATKKKYTGRYLLRRTLYRSQIFDNIQMEFEILGSISHQHIQKLIETTYDHKVLAQIVESEEISILDYYRYDFPLTEHVAGEIFYRLVDAVSYLHSNSIVHLDIRPENVFVCENRFKLGGFLSSRYAAEDEVITGNYGTLNYQAPEIFSNNNFDGRKADIWACGVFLISILTGKLPFGSDVKSVDKNTVSLIGNEVQFNENYIPSYLSDEVKDILGLMMQRDPSKRAKITTIRDHPWLNNARQHLQTDPTAELPPGSKPLQKTEPFLPPPPSNTAAKEISSTVEETKEKTIYKMKKFFGENCIKNDSMGNFIIDVNGQQKTIIQAKVEETANKKSTTISMILISGSSYKFNELFTSLINEIEFV